MERDVQEIRLPGGERVLAAVHVLRPEQLPGGDGDMGAARSDDADRAGGEFDGFDEPEGFDEVDEFGEFDEFEDSGAVLDQVSARVEQLNELVTGVGSAVLSAARAVRPDEVSATFGVEVAVTPGKAVAMLADGQAKGAISVTLTWHADRGGDNDPPGGTAGDRDGDEAG